MMAKSAERWYTDAVFEPAGYDETGQRNWARALQTYRTALRTYRHLLEAKLQRAENRQVALPPILARVNPTRTWSKTLAGLTAREREVAELISRGYTNAQIAERLVLTRGTVANHVAHILGKVGVTNRTQVAARVLKSEELDASANGHASGERPGHSYPERHSPAESRAASES
jgi:DNA-binding CsgD family transcriptional regulator